MSILHNVLFIKITANQNLWYCNAYYIQEFLAICHITESFLMVSIYFRT